MPWPGIYTTVFKARPGRPKKCKHEYGFGETKDKPANLSSEIQDFRHPSFTAGGIKDNWIHLE